MNLKPFVDHSNGRLQEIVEYAKETNQTDKLELTLKHLARHKKEDTEVHLFHDFAPYSLYFQVMRGDKCILGGGVIYHGKHDQGGNGGAPTFSVNLTPSYGWEIHT